MKKLILIPFLLLCLLAEAATVDTVAIYSNSMKKAFNCVVITPKAAKGKRTSATWPVVYLLHGYSGGYNNWIRRVPELSQYADDYNLFIVCPDGGYSSWYVDSPMDSSLRYETYIGEEVPAYIDAHYPTRKDRRGRAITGLSMGGHGGMFLGLRHSDRFGACGSMSGGVDLNDVPRNRYDIDKRLGDTINHIDNWTKYSVVTLIDHYPKNPLKIIIDCGTEDFFYSINHQLHEKMLKLKIPHDYIERPGRHDWAYWRNAVKYQLLFFSDYFSGKPAQ